MAKKKEEKIIRISSRDNTFWRCGKQFFRDGTEYKESDFTPEELKIFKEDPDLIFQEFNSAVDFEKSLIPEEMQEMAEQIEALTREGETKDKTIENLQQEMAKLKAENEKLKAKK